MVDADNGGPADHAAELSEERRALLTMELARRLSGADRPVRADRVGDRPCFPLSYGQQRMWFLDQADPGSVAYVMPGGLRLHGRLDAAALRAACDEIVRRHEVLRTTYHARSGVPEQRIDPPRAVDLPEVDLSGMAPDARQAAVEERRRREAARPFDLTRDPMLRGVLITLAPEDHVVLLTTHHIAADGWSLGVLLRELGALYSAFRRGEPSPLSDLDIQYADYAVWQAGRGDVIDRQVGYWRRRLDGAQALELPTSASRDTERDWRGSSVPVSIPRSLYAEAAAFASESGASPYMVLLAAFAVVLARWSGRRDVVIGSPLAGRGHPELEPLVGFFVNTLPLRVDTADAPTFRTLLGRVRTACAEDYTHQDVPFEKLVQELVPDRGAGTVPLVSVMLALRDVPMGSPRLDGLDVEWIDQAESRSHKFDVVVDLIPEPDGELRGRIEFSTELFDDAVAEGIGRALVGVLRAGVTGPDRVVDDLPLLEPADRDTVVGPLSGTGDARAAESASCIHTIIEEMARSRPDAPAVRSGDVRLTYRELVERANGLAHRLRAAGAGVEGLVGVCLPKSAEMVVALLAIMKAGAGYVPLDPVYPRRRVARMLSDSGVAAVVTTGEIAESDLLTGDDPATQPPELVVVDGDGAPCPTSDAPPVRVGNRATAYVIYTSGSTGLPKGSANEHGGVVNTLRGLNETLGLTSADRMLAISSLNYDMSVYEILGPLMAGACVVVPSETVATDPVRLRDLLIEEEVTVWSSAPALLEMLAGHVVNRGGLTGSRLRLAVLGGDRLPPALADRLADLLPGLQLYNLAGMTEVSYCSTFHPVQRPEPVPGNIPWGRPLPNQRLYVLDPHGEPVPIGARGELYIGGAGVRRGYLRRPALTAERFVPDPFGAVPGGRLYRTGDGARWRGDGTLEFLGRLDGQVKLRGFRIEPGEIEAVLGAHPDVGECVVVLRDDPGGGRIVGYLTAASPLPPSTGELRRYLLDRLPVHMVPSAFVLLDRLPLLPSGKLDRAALPPAPVDRAELEGEYIPPGQPLEQVLAGIWAEVLDLDRVGVTDDFFALGGHSLLVTQVVSRIRDLFRVEFPIRAFLGVGTVRGLTTRLRELGTDVGVDPDRIADLVLHVGALDDAEVAEGLAE